MIDPRLIALLDEMEIRNVVARLAHLADLADDLEEYFSLWTDDCVYDVRDPAGWEPGMPSNAKIIRGVADMIEDRKMLRGTGFQGPGTDVYHANSTLAVKVNGDGSAQATSYWSLIDGKDPASLRRVGVYHDTFRRTPEGWRLEQRIIIPNGG